MVDDIIHFGGRTHVVPESKLRENIMRAMCCSPLIGNSGYSYEYEAPHVTGYFRMRFLDSTDYLSILIVIGIIDFPVQFGRS
jgi:hypothetical protein